MATYDSHTVQQTVAACKVGAPLTWAGTAVARETILATANTEYPVGIAKQDGAIGDWVTVSRDGEIVKGIASAAIAVGALVTATTGGKFVTCTKKGAYETATEYIWGVAWTAAGADGDIFEIKFRPQELGQ